MQVELEHKRELVCLEQRHDLLAVGSVGHVTLLDPRRWATAASVPAIGATAPGRQGCCHQAGGWTANGGSSLPSAVQQRILCTTNSMPAPCAELPALRFCFGPARRRAAELSPVASPDDNQGVRSMQLQDHLLSFGTGRGMLFLYDLRAQAFLPTGGCSRGGATPAGLVAAAVAAAAAAVLGWLFAGCRPPQRMACALLLPDLSRSRIYHLL